MHSNIRAELWPYLLFVASLPFPSILQLRFSSITFQLADILFLLAAAAWAVAYAARRRFLIPTWFYACLAAYALVIVLSAICSADPARSSVKVAGKFYLIGAAVLSLNSVTNMNDLKTVIRAWLIGAGLSLTLSVTGIILFYAGFTDPSRNIVLHPIFGSLPPGNYPRIEGFFFHPAMLCNFLGVTWMFVLLSGSANWLKMRSFRLFSVGLLVVNAFTLTPGLGGIFLSSAYFFRKKLLETGHRHLGRSAMAAGILLAAAFFIAASVTLFSYDPDGTRVPLISGSISPSHRAVAWRTTFETFLQNPILGHGVGLPVARSEFIDPSGNRQYLGDAHNTYLSVLGETGLAGFFTFMSIIGFLLFGLARWRTQDALQNTVRACLLLALCDAFFYQSLTGSYEDARHLWVFFGISAAAIRLVTNQER